MTATSDSPPAVRLWRGAYDAVIFDLDGVLTRTARVHATAWKHTFDEFLERRAAARGEAFRPFDADADYRRYVDGKPRDEGVGSFLRSREIDLPHGNDEDPPDAETVWGLGNRKRDRFLTLLEQQGVEVDRAAPALVEVLAAANVGMAVVSSSRNCRHILENTGLLQWFDVVLDGEERKRLRLAGKPAPDTFLEAARRLGVAPQRSVVFEDATSGVEAARRGGFGCVIGVDRGDQATALRLAGAHVTVASLSGVTLTESEVGALRHTSALTSALQSLAELRERLGGRRLAVFLDYDGTLTPIVRRPEDARLPKRTRGVLAALATSMPVAIISGRDLADVRQLVNVDGIFYAGSHGFDIVDPRGESVGAGPGEAFVGPLDAAERELRHVLDGVAGAAVERKRFTIAVHYRRVREAEVPGVGAAVDAVAARHPRLRRAHGKKVFELQPDVEWDKGRAVLHVLEIIKRRGGPSVPLYVGDDLTDEEAFRAIALDGLSIIVREEPRPTLAQYALDSPAEVAQFLEALGASPQPEPRP